MILRESNNEKELLVFKLKNDSVDLNRPQEKYSYRHKFVQAWQSCCEREERKLGIPGYIYCTIFQPVSIYLYISLG